MGEGSGDKCAVDVDQEVATRVSLSGLGGQELRASGVPSQKLVLSAKNHGATAVLWKV